MTFGHTSLAVGCAILAVLPFAPAEARTVEVSNAAGLREAVRTAMPGDELVLADGVYALTSTVDAAASGTPAQPITVRARNLHAAKVEVNAEVGFRVSGRHWRFEGLEVVGTCASDDVCEHAFQVTGDAQGFTLRESRLIDFNAQVKVNAAPGGDGGWQIPHDGLIERNAVFDTRGRQTGKPVTKLNIDTGDRWVVRDNLIHDFHKLGGNGISYGAFMKSGGRDGVFERNLVLCTRSVQAQTVQIGLSFGGGGTGPRFCAPAFDEDVPCDPEHSGGVMRNNVIANCSDVGVYLNSARDTQVLFNTLVGTTGIDFRFASSTGEADGNLLTSVVRARNGASFDRGTNRENVSVAQFESWYRAPLEGDLATVGDVSALVGAAPSRPEVPDDFCARSRAGRTAVSLGAVEHALGDCEGWPGEPLPPGPDAGLDAGTDADAGALPPPDAAVPSVDAGVTDGGTTPLPEERSSGCASTGAATAGLFGLLLLAASVGRRPRGPR